MSRLKDHISVCICTFKRAKLLAKLLIRLQNQKRENLFTYSIVVVDNDFAQSAKPIIDNLKQKSFVAIDYFCEPEKNISLARNLTIKNADGNYVAFIDDDEYPVDNWLFNLYQALNKYNSDGILGPVKPYFHLPPPKWLASGKLFNRKSFQTGTILKSKETRTGNVLLKKENFYERPEWFSVELGKTGGEDVDFFKRMMDEGQIFRWCNEAPVYELVPPERCSRSYFLKRALLRGEVNSKNQSTNILHLVKSLIALSIYTFALPFLFLIDEYLFMRYLIKNCDHLGKILGFCGISFIKEKTF